MFYAPVVCTKTSDVSAWTWTWTWTVLKHRNLVLGLALGLESQVLGLGLGLAVWVLGLVLVVVLAPWKISRKSVHIFLTHKLQKSRILQTYSPRRASPSIDNHKIYKFYAPVVSTKTSDVSAWTWNWTVLKHRNLVLGLVLGFEGQVLGLGLGLAVWVLGLVLGLEGWVLGLRLGIGTQVLVNNTGAGPFEQQQFGTAGVECINMHSECFRCRCEKIIGWRGTERTLTVLVWSTYLWQRCGRQTYHSIISEYYTANTRCSCRYNRCCNCCPTHYAVVTSETKLFWHNVEIISVLYFTCNHWRWLHVT